MELVSHVVPLYSTFSVS